MFNKIILMGRICHDLELKSTPNGVSVLSFRIAVDRNYQVKGEERKADFFNVVAWRSTAEFVSKYFGKGRMVMVNGELQTRQYVDKNNVTQNIVEIVADTIHFTGEKPSNNNGGNGYNNNGGGYSGGYGNNQSPPSHPAETANAAPAAIESGTNNDFSSPANNDEDDYPF
jgi:single-strand DNA-binding protein